VKATTPESYVGGLWRYPLPSAVQAMAWQAATPADEG